MKKEDFLSAVAEIDDDLLGPVAAEEAKREKRRIRVLFPIVAACVVAVAVALFAVSLGMRKPQTAPGIAATDDRSDFISDEKDPYPSDSPTETDPAGDLTTETETETEKETETETDPDPVDPYDGYNMVSDEPAPGPDTPGSDTEKAGESSIESEKSTVDPPATDKQSESVAVTENDPVPSDTETDGDPTPVQPPVDTNCEATVEDLCFGIFSRLEDSSFVIPGGAAPEVNPAPAGDPGDDPVNEGPEESSGRPSGYTERETGSVWYYYNVVCGGHGTSADAFRSIASGYANTPLLKGRFAKMLVDYLRYHIDDTTYEFMLSYMAKRDYPGFSDVGDGTEYADEIASAYVLGLIEPESDETFGVYEPVTVSEINDSLVLVYDYIISVQ